MLCRIHFFEVALTAIITTLQSETIARLLIVQRLETASATASVSKNYPPACIDLCPKGSPEKVSALEL